MKVHWPYYWRTKGYATTMACGIRLSIVLDKKHMSKDAPDITCGNCIRVLTSHRKHKGDTDAH